MFDSIPRWFSRRTVKGLRLSDRYVAPPMPFAFSADQGVAWPEHPWSARRPRHRAAARPRDLEGDRLAGWDRLGPCAVTDPASRCWNSADDPLRAFLRGVNVGGVNLKMAEVAAAFEKAGFTGVRTVLASGNVLLESRAASPRSARRPKPRCARSSVTTPGCSPTISTACGAISDAYPFEREVEGHHSYVTFVTDDAVLDELAELAKRPDPTKRSNAATA